LRQSALSGRRSSPSAYGATPLAIICPAARLALLRVLKLEAVVSIGFSY
jgi:hypothetical protein